jgi:hypothetical protein
MLRYAVRFVTLHFAQFTSIRHFLCRRVQFNTREIINQPVTILYYIVRTVADVSVTASALHGQFTARPVGPSICQEGQDVSHSDWSFANRVPMLGSSFGFLNSDTFKLFVFVARIQLQWRMIYMLWAW